MTKDQFVSRAVVELLRHNVAVDIRQTRLLDDGFSGGFGTCPRKFTVALAGAGGFSTFVHEYCHFRQSLEKPRFWSARQSAVGDYFTWLDMPTKRRPLKALKAVMELEWDCEQRAINMIRELKLPLSIRTYTRHANLYLYSYVCATQFRNWPTPPKGHSSIYPALSPRLANVDHYLDIGNVPSIVVKRFQKDS